jgi:hypothetical protein
MATILFSVAQVLTLFMGLLDDDFVRCVGCMAFIAATENVRSSRALFYGSLLGGTEEKTVDYL